jgi:hypothetical protein
MMYGELCQSISWEGNEVKLKPLQQFICDECGGLIKKVDDGCIVFQSNLDRMILKKVLVGRSDE